MAFFICLGRTHNLNGLEVLRQPGKHLFEHFILLLFCHLVAHPYPTPLPVIMTRPYFYPYPAPLVAAITVIAARRTIWNTVSAISLTGPRQRTYWSWLTTSISPSRLLAPKGNRWPQEAQAQTRSQEQSITFIHRSPKRAVPDLSCYNPA